MNLLVAIILFLVIIPLALIAITLVLTPIEYCIALFGRIFKLDTSIDSNQEKPTEKSAKKILESKGNHPTVDAGKVSLKW